MELYYQNETLYVEIVSEIAREDYEEIRRKVFHIIEDYGVERVVIQNNCSAFFNRRLLNMLKQDCNHKFNRHVLIK